MSLLKTDEAFEPDGEELLVEAELPLVGVAVLDFTPSLAYVLLLIDEVVDEAVVAVVLTLAVAG